MTTRKSGFITATMLALSLAASANLAPKAVAAAAEGQTRQWRGFGFCDRRARSTAMCGQQRRSFMQMAPPSEIFGREPSSTAISHPRTYRFTVQPYGLPTGQTDTVSLAPGSQTYLQIQWAGSWQYGYPEAGWGFKPNTFVVTTMSPQLAQAYLPTLTYHPE